MNIKESNLRIVELLARGFTVKEIASKTKMAKRTVDARIIAMKKKYEARTLPQLTLKVILENLVYFSAKE